MNADDILHFTDDDDAAAPTAGAAAPSEPTAPLPAPWQVLVVDDDADVHDATRFALRGMVADGRPIALLHAHSAAEGLAVLTDHPGIAVALVDVVMETDDAGLQLVAQARQTLGRHLLRVILRTGQPGLAPELETIQRYDINDYKTKSELTRNRLHVSLLAALRSHEQLRRLEVSRAGLEKVINASRSLTADSGMGRFAEGIIQQLAGLVGIEVQGLVCVRSTRGQPEDSLVVDFTVIAAAGPYSHLVNQRAEQISALPQAQCLAQCLAERRNVLRAHDMALYFPGAHGRDTAAYVGLPGPLDDTNRRLLDLFCANITVCADNVDLVAQLRESAYVDEQLGIPNQQALIKHLDSLREGAGAADLVLVLVDIDQFAEINDMLGLQMGDQLLKALTVPLTAVVGHQGLVARVSGNTFAVLGPAALVTESALRQAVAQPFAEQGIGMPLSACQGWVHGNQVAASDSSAWLKKAAIALKRAKSRGLGQCETYQLSLSQAAEARTRLLHALHQAVDSGQLSLVYQPKVRLLTGEVVGLEALMRWQRPDGSMVPPDRFIPVAEQSGLILPMGDWALHTALADLRRLHAEGHSSLHVAVNVTASQFRQADFVDQVLDALQAQGMSPSALELEITESVAMAGQTQVVAVLHALRAAGISLAIDDFGTGYSSLSYLDQLPAHRLKIDRTFVQRLGGGGPGARIAQLIVPLGHQMGMTVVAEGVETACQAQMLGEMGCDEVQGYLFARPMAMPQLLAWLALPLDARRAAAAAQT